MLPSPESLKRKVIVKAKKQAPAEKEIESESEEEEEAGKIAVDMKANIQEVPYKIILESEVLLYFVYHCCSIEKVSAEFFCNVGTFWYHISEDCNFVVMFIHSKRPKLHIHTNQWVKQLLYIEQ